MNAEFIIESAEKTTEDTENTENITVRFLCKLSQTSVFSVSPW